jgi:hypothetical protein
MFARSLVLSLLVGCWFAGSAFAEPLVEPYLLEGKLSEGETALLEHLEKEPADDDARFGLGVIQFLQTFEHLGASLHRHGLRTEEQGRAVGVNARELGFPQNPNPEKLSYEQSRKIVQTVVADLEKAEATLAGIKSDAVKLPLHVGLIKIDLFGTGRPVNAMMLSRQMRMEIREEEIKDFVIAFDRGDVHWLRGYCHFLAALGEVCLAVDGQELFERTAHLFFQEVESPHAFLQEDRGDITNFDFAAISDMIAFVHLWRFPIKEPERAKAALAHLEAMVTQAKEMWKHYLAETDDDREWIPNPRQTGVVGVAVTQEIVDTWLATLDELELVLQGKKVVPFWRGKQNNARGINIRRVFTEPRTFDVILWVQGTAATPYLEEGEQTKFADPRMLQRMNETFGGANFIGFALWFN